VRTSTIATMSERMTDSNTITDCIASTKQEQNQANKGEKS
jgi:hypothetical protein